MRYTQRPSAESVIKALANIARHPNAAAAVENAELAGDPEQLGIIKNVFETVHGTPGVDNGVAGIFDSLLAIAQRQSLPGKINAIFPFFEVPKDVRTLAANDNPQAGFVQEGYPAPVFLTDLETITMRPKVIRAIQILTAELARSSHAEHLLSRGLIRAAADAESAAFFSSDAATDAAPAGLLYGITPKSGTADLSADVQTLVDAFDGDLARAVLVASPKSAVKLAGLYDGAGINGDMAGVPIVAHQAVGAGQLAIAEPGRIMTCDDGLNISKSEQAYISARDSSDNEVKLSLWQQNLIAFSVERHINWRPAADAVVWLDGGAW